MAIVALGFVLLVMALTHWMGPKRKSKIKLYGNRSAYDINRHHVNDVLNNRLPKYIDDWANTNLT